MPNQLTPEIGIGNVISDFLSGPKLTLAQVRVLSLTPEGVYDFQTMGRTDRRGRVLKTFLAAEIVGKDVTVEQLREAVGVKRSRWYGDASTPGRSHAADFPDPNELYHLAERYQLGDDGWLNLLVEFGWLAPRPDLPGFTDIPAPNGKGTTTTLSERDWNHNGPPV